MTKILLSSNIDGNNVTNGETIVPYFRAFPPKGTGYHRHVFVLYKQEKKIDLKEFQVTEADSVEKRTFSTLDFYRKFQDDLTPAGLCFFQADYDRSVRKVFHEKLGGLMGINNQMEIFLMGNLFISLQEFPSPSTSTISQRPS